MKYLLPSSIIIALCVSIYPAEAARPIYGEQRRTTLRVLRSGATNLEEVRRSTYGQKAPQYETFLNEMLGFSVEYSKDWESSYVTVESLANAIVHFAPSRNVRSTLSVWVKEKTAATYEDLEKDFARFARQPTNDYQTETMSHIHELKNAEHEQVQWNGQPVLLSTFEAGGVQSPYKYKQVRIPAGSKLYVLSFAASSEYYESEVHRFDPFFTSFTTFVPATHEQIKPSRSERRATSGIQSQAEQRRLKRMQR